MAERKHPSLPALILLLVVTGCAQVNTIRLAQDRPADLDTLLEHREFERARLLTGRYPSIDTAEVQSKISTLETEYEGNVYSQARKLEADHDLLGAVQLLTDSLQQLPHSKLLRTLRTDLEQQRVHELRVNERNMLLARAGFLLEQRKLYRQQVKLEPLPPPEQQKYERQQAQSADIAGSLVEHAGYARQTGDLDAASSCLELSLQLDPSGRAEKMLSEMQEKEQEKQRSAQQAASTKQARIARDRSRDDKTETRQLLEATQQALEQNRLQAAQAALARVPPSTSKDSAVMAAQVSLDQVVNSRVKNLVTAGDAQYRAEKIAPALKIWSEALSLDPDNPEILKRIDRANKVLANLKALKRQQQK
jgi:tetratricopeptide (TPR) repeat protein